VLEATNNPFNAAIDGPGWFVAQRPDGTQALNRSGAFKIIDEKLRFSDGMPVVAEQGTITVPAGGQLDIAEDGTVNVKFATNPVTTQILGRLKLVNPPPRTLLRDRDGLFVTLDKSVDQLTADPAIKIRGKFLESSNVSTANAMLQIITQSRAFDMNMKMVQPVSENDKVATSLIGRAR